MPVQSAGKIDRDLMAALMVPARQKEFAGDPRAFVRVDHSLRAYWHTLFDVCPDLLKLTGPDGQAIFRPFMAWAAEQHLSFGWTFYLWVYVWLRDSEFRDRLDHELVMSLIAASAARWAMLDRSESGGVVLGCLDLPGLVCGWKPRTLDTGRRVEYLELEEALPAPSQAVGFFTTPGAEIEIFKGWYPIPR